MLGTAYEEETAAEVMLDKVAWEQWDGREMVKQEVRPLLLLGSVLCSFDLPEKGIGCDFHELEGLAFSQEPIIGEHESVF